MSGTVKYCKECFKDPNREIDAIKAITGWNTEYAKQHICVGYYTPDENKNSEFCQYHTDEKLCNSNLTTDEYLVLNSISVDYNFFQAMEQLKENDIIEFNLKMSQFKTQTQQQNICAEIDTTPKCPHCKSTNIKPISALNRGASIAMWGIFSKKINKSFECLNCKYMW